MSTHVRYFIQKYFFSLLLKDKLCWKVVKYGHFILREKAVVSQYYYLSYNKETDAIIKCEKISKKLGQVLSDLFNDLKCTEFCFSIVFYLLTHLNKIMLRLGYNEL